MKTKKPALFPESRNCMQNLLRHDRHGRACMQKVRGFGRHTIYSILRMQHIQGSSQPLKRTKHGDDVISLEEVHVCCRMCHCCRFLIHLNRQDASTNTVPLVSQLVHCPSKMFVHLRKKNHKGSLFAFTWKTTTMPWFWISTAPRRLWQVILFTAKYSIKRIDTFAKQSQMLQQKSSLQRSLLKPI